MSPSGVSDLLGRALHVLETLAGMEQPASLLAVAEATGLRKASAYRVLRSLQDEGYIDHLSGGGYRIGNRSIALASLLRPRPSLLQRASPMLSRLAAQVGETATLHLRSGEHRVLVLGAQPTLNRQSSFPMLVGYRSPLTAGSSGRAILAHLPREQAEKVIATYAGGRERAWFERELEAIRTTGYGVSFGENYLDFNGISKAVVNPDDGNPLGSLVIAGAKDRLPEESLRGLAAPLTAACRQLAPQLYRIDA